MRGGVRRSKMKFPAYMRETSINELILNRVFYPVWVKQSLPLKKRMWYNRLKAHLNRECIFYEN